MTTGPGTADTRQLLLDAYDALFAVFEGLTDHLIDEAERLDNYWNNAPIDAIGFEDVDPEIDTFRSNVYDLAEQIFDLLRERYPDVPNANDLERSSTPVGNPS